MADAREDQNRDRLDEAMVNMARGRLALGVAAFAAPQLTVRLMGVGKGPDAGRDYVTRMFAAREIALGAGYLLSKGKARGLWARLGLAVDTLDTVNGLRSRGGVPLWVTAGSVGVAAGSAALGAAKVARDTFS